MAVEVYAFVSTKGGTGKTTLAVATALALAERGRRVAVYDLDLSGSSIGDGLPLCAPEVAGEDGQVSLASPAPSLLNRPATLRARAKRAAERQSFRYLPYLNDALLHTAERGEGPFPGSYAWRRGPDDPVAWFPSSPCLHDVAVASDWVKRRDLDRLGLRFFDLAEAACQALKLDAILLDLPPGVAGFTELFLRRYRQAAGVFSAVTPVFVTTPDRNDLLPSTDYFARAVLAYPSMRFVLNRSRQPISSVREEVRKALGDRLGPARAENRLRAIAFHPDTLGQCFVNEKFEITQTILDEILTALELR